MSSVAVRDFLKARRDRALGSILGHMERTVWHKLTPEEQTSIRNYTIDALNSYHDSILDLQKSESEDDAIRNEEVLTLLERLNRQFDKAMSSNGSA